jgi:demethyl-4-deoxygadusol synthase
MLDRVIAFGHTWSPTLELAPKIPLRHGHAINIDMAYSTTVAWKRGLITVEERDRILRLMSRVGLTLDHELFEIELVWKATQSIMLTRDGKQRAAMPHPIGECVFLNDLTYDELKQGLEEHKALVKSYPRAGDGLDAYVDQCDYMDLEEAQTEASVLSQKLDADVTLASVSTSKSPLSVDLNAISTEKGNCTAM